MSVILSSGSGSVHFVSECGVSIFRVLADYESLFDDEIRRNSADEIGERIIEEQATITLAQRFLALQGKQISLTLRNGEKVHGNIIDVATSWVLIDGAGEENLVPLTAIVEASLQKMALPEDVRISAKLGVASILRKLAQRSVSVRVVHDGGAMRGVIDAVYADHFDICAEKNLQADVRDDASGPIVAIPLRCVNKISVTSTGW